MPERLCEDCAKYMAVVKCDSCGKALCKKCRCLAICRADDGELAIKYFCLRCRNDTFVNPDALHEEVFGLDKVTDMVNHDPQRNKRFKIKLKI